MTHQRAFDFRCPKSVPGHVQDVINPTNDPEIAILIASCAVSGKIITFEFAPVLLPVTALIAVNRAQHRGPRATNDQFPADICADLAPLLINNCWIDAEKRQRCAAGFCRNRAGQWRDQDRSGFCLPPSRSEHTTLCRSRAPSDQQLLDRRRKKAALRCRVLSESRRAMA